MKKLAILWAAAVVLAATGAVAQNLRQQYDQLPELTEDEWWQKQGFGYMQVYYTQYKAKYLVDPMYGGGFAMGGEYVNDDVHVGIGGRFLLSWVMMDEKGYSANDRQIGLDLYVPVRISSSLTLYGGGGGTLHGFDLDFDDDSGYFGGDKWHQDQLVATTSAFAGLRWRFYNHLMVFAEDRREFGEIKMVCENYEWTSDYSHPKMKIDMAGNRFFAGVGVTF